MRRQIKKKFEEVVSSLRRAERTLEKLIVYEKKDGNIEQLLEDMQNCAIELGNSIEESEGEGTKSVLLLEEYCDLLWQCFSSKEGVERKHIAQQIQNKGQEIADTLNEEFTEVKEVVFVVFRKDMWDGIEKLWQEFLERQDCTCYLIPAPFYEKKPDGSVVRCYEGEEFPDELPVVWYDDYEWEEKNADVIVLQDMEKNDGRCTWPEERFQKEKLEECAELLVEVPYAGK